jgi:serine/threonine protein kinase
MNITELEQFSSQYGTLANFDVGKKIGKGQFAEVFRATCKHDGRVFALKKLVVQ